MKAGAMEWEQIAKLLIVLFLVLILAIIIMFFKDVMIEKFTALKRVIWFR